LEDAGGVALVVGQPDRATALLEESMATGQALQAAGLGATPRPYHLGTVAHWRGDADSAVAWYERLLEITREHEHTAGIADNLAGLGRAVLLQGDVARAVALLEESLQLASGRANRSGAARALYGLGLAAWQAGDGALALARLHESLAVRHQMNARLGIVECLEALAEVTVGSAATAEEVRRDLTSLGR